MLPNFYACIIKLLSHPHPTLQIITIYSSIIKPIIIHFLLLSIVKIIITSRHVEINQAVTLIN